MWQSEMLSLGQVRAGNYGHTDRTIVTVERQLHAIAVTQIA